jgi:hypothetical protein
MVDALLSCQLSTSVYDRHPNVSDTTMLDIDFDKLVTPAIYYREQVFLTELDPSPNARHWFGGELDVEIGALPDELHPLHRILPIDLPDGPYPLHRILTIDMTDGLLGVLAGGDLKHVPLIYGMRYEACDLAYRVASPRRIEIKRWAGRASVDDWPYDGYPDSLPRVGLRLLDPVPASLEEFGKLTHQGIDFGDPDEMIIIVPSTADYGGVSLWGKHGWGVQLIYYFTPDDRSVSVEQQID